MGDYNEYKSIMNDVLDSAFENANSEKDYKQIVEACESALQRAKDELEAFEEGE